MRRLRVYACVRDGGCVCMCEGWRVCVHVRGMEGVCACVRDAGCVCMCEGWRVCVHV